MQQLLQAVNGTESAIRIPDTSAHFPDTTRQGDEGEGRLRYLTGGTGAPLVMVHTVRTQAEHFRHLIPLVRERYTVYALDLPGMGYSQIVPGASYDEPAMRAAVKRLITQLDLRDVTLLGESMGAVLALTTAADLPERVRRVLAINAYDHAGGIARSSLLARLLVTGVLAPGAGRLFAQLEPKPILRRAERRRRRQDRAAAELRRRAPRGRPPPGLPLRRPRGVREPAESCRGPLSLPRGNGAGAPNLRRRGLVATLRPAGAQAPAPRRRIHRGAEGTCSPATSPSLRQAPVSSSRLTALFGNAPPERASHSARSPTLKGR